MTGFTVDPATLPLLTTGLVPDGGNHDRASPHPGLALSLSRLMSP